MKTLILMRHAKSSWSYAGLSDFDRPLNARGTRSARALGEWLRAKAYLPDEVLCSSAVRTAETLDGLGLDIAPQFTRRLYHADEAEMWEVLHAATGACVLMIGHKPGIAGFAAELVATPPAHDRFDDYPTGATLVVRFDTADWAEVRPRSGAVVDYTVPRDIMHDDAEE